MTEKIDKLQAALDSLDYNERMGSLVELAGLLQAGQIKAKPESEKTNLHFHTFYSFNCCGYSPCKVAWLSKLEGLAVCGIVDFDVLDGVDEFLKACEILGLRGCGGMETRAFVPEFADKVINSPGEPGISYHMGTGFCSQQVMIRSKDFLLKLKKTAGERNRELLKKVNAFLSPVELDYDSDVLTLTPADNPTERHICFAYAKKAKEVFENESELKAFWSEKLGVDADGLDLPNGAKLINAIRAKTMKKGGVGYVQPTEKSFPKLEDVNSFVLQNNGLPTLAWLDGTSDGERQMEELLKIEMQTGVCVVNIIPDRNYSAGKGKEDVKCKNLYDFVELCQKYDLPIIAGTEMNSPGQKFVDSFDTDELKPLVPTFLKGAMIVYAHSVLFRKTGIAYNSKWAQENFNSLKDRNDFFEQIGRKILPCNEELLDGISITTKASEIISKLSL